MPRRLFMAIALSTMMALMLSLIPGSTWFNREVETFQNARTVQLSAKNGVDLFTRVSTHYNIKRVKWDNPAVYVDLAVKPGERVELSHVCQDFYNWAYELFTYTDNVKQVYFRLIEESGKGKGSRLLVAIQADRSEMAGSVLPKDAGEDVVVFVKKRFPVRIDPYFYERVIP